VQDQLYKDFVKAEKENHNLKEEKALVIRNLESKFHEQTIMVGDLQKLVQAFKDSAPE
jgi:hypothetical protein